VANTLEFPDLLRLIGERSVAFRAAVASAPELVLVLYGRTPVDSLKVDGDRQLFDLLMDWDPDA
jgi:hypothetical protein